MPRLRPLNRAINALIMHKQKVAQIGQNLGDGMMAYKQGGEVLFPPAIFWAPLTSSLTPTVGGDATFTRGASSAGTVIDQDGVIRNVTDNEARFLGARRVHNVHYTISDFSPSQPSHSAYEYDAATGIGSLYQTAQSSVLTNVGGVTFADVAGSLPIGDLCQAQIQIRLKSGYKAGPSVAYTLSAVGAANVDVTSQLTYEWQTFAGNKSAVSTIDDFINDFIAITCVNSADPADWAGIEIRNMQFENVTGQTNQNPSEYVSAGVGTEPELIDDTTFLDLTTYWNDALPATITQMLGGGLEVDATAAAASGNVNTIAKSNTLVTDNALYLVEIKVSNYAATTPPTTVDVDVWLGDINSGNFDIKTLQNGVHRAVVRGSVDAGIDGDVYVQFTTNRIAGQDVFYELDYVSVKEIDHGSNVDGVKYFETLNGNTVASNVVTEGTGAAIPATTLRGILIESGSTNRLLDSEEFLTATSAWSNQGCTPVIHSTEVSPMGSKNVTDLFANNLGGSSDAVQVYQALSMVSNEPMSFSVYAKANTLDWISLETSAFTSGNGNSFFDLANGVIGTKSVNHSDSYMEDMGNGWYRCVVTVGDVGADNNGILRIRLATADGNNVVNLDGTEGVYIVGAQGEASLIRATSYIPTEGSTTNRGLERLTYELPAVIAAVISELSVYAECYQWYHSGVLSRAISIYSATTTNVYYMAASATATWITIAFDGTTVAIAEGIADADGTKLCDALVDGSLSLTQDGLAEVVDVTAPANVDFSNADTTFDIGSSAGTGQFLNGAVKDVKLWGVALTEEQRISLTS